MSEQLLTATMTSLVRVLRELLANMEQEQHAILVQDAPAFQIIMNHRSPLLESMHTCRKTMVSEIEKLHQSHPGIEEMITEKDHLMNLAQLAGEENVELLTLRDQILALTEEMDKQNLRNNFLLNNQLADTTNEKEKYSHQFKPVRKRPQQTKNVRQKKISIKTMEISSEVNE